MKIAVVTDSNSGITQAEGKRLGIFVLPMPFMIDGQEYLARRRRAGNASAHQACLKHPGGKAGRVCKGEDHEAGEIHDDCRDPA